MRQIFRPLSSHGAMRASHSGEARTRNRAADCAPSAGGALWPKLMEQPNLAWSFGARLGTQGLESDRRRASARAG